MEDDIEKQKRIKQEIAKAEADAMDETSSKANLAYFDSKEFQRKGYSRDPEDLRRSAERLSNISIIAVITGAVLGVLSLTIANTVSGMVGGAISSIIGTLGMALLGISALTAVFSIVATIYYRAKTKNHTGVALTAVISLILLVVYAATMLLIMNFR